MLTYNRETIVIAPLAKFLKQEDWEGVRKNMDLSSLGFEKPSAVYTVPYQESNLMFKVYEANTQDFKYYLEKAYDETFWNYWKKNNYKFSNNTRLLGTVMDDSGFLVVCSKEDLEKYTNLESLGPMGYVQILNFTGRADKYKARNFHIAGNGNSKWFVYHETY